MKSYKYRLLIFFSLFVIFSCKKSNPNDSIPYVPVSVTVYLNLPSNIALNSIGNYVKISGGYKGIIVYRRSQTEFAAYDLACPYDPTAGNAILQVDSSGIATVDLHCGSKFDLAYGTILNGPSTLPMKAYNTEYNGGNTLYIFN